MECAGTTRLGPGRHSGVERFQSLLQTLSKTFALPFTADVVDPYSSIAIEHEGGSTMDTAATRAGGVVGLGKPHDTRDMGRGLGNDGGGGKAG